MFLHATSCEGLVELNNFFKKITPEEFINVITEKFGYNTYYTVIWKSNEKHDLR